MKKILLLLCFCVLFYSLTNASLAQNICNDNVCQLEEVADSNNSFNIEIVEFIKNYEKTQNSHNLISLKKFYADEFVNTDGFNKEQLFKLMKNTFDSYPDITSFYNIEQINLQGNYATAFTSQKVEATTKNPSKITGDKGKYSANLKNIFYLKRIGKVWKIYSEDVVSEVSSLSFGVAKNINATINAPQKVLTGTDYCAGVNVDPPEGYSAIASINSTQIVDDFNLQGEVFRQVTTSDNELERILKANNKNNNEAVVVSLGFTKINTDMFKKKKIDIEGLLLLMQRVDIVPATSNLEIQNAKNNK